MKKPPLAEFLSVLGQLMFVTAFVIVAIFVLVAIVVS